jgi:2,4-dienoyl-CoA reductase (NADPH2)
VTGTDLVDGGYDAVVLATGVTPRALDIPGIDHPNVLSYIDVLKHKAPVGERVAVVGAGGIGFDVAEFLTHNSHGSSKKKEKKKNKNNKGADAAAGGAGPDLDEFMSKWGVDMTNSVRGGLVAKAGWNSPRQVQLLQRKTSKHGKNLGKTTGWIHRAGLLNAGVQPKPKP